MNIKEIIKFFQTVTKKTSNEKFLMFFIYPIIVIGTISILIFADPVIKVATIILWSLFLFTTEKFPVDITSMLIMITVIISGLVTPAQGVSGFSNTATITVLCMFILSAGIEKTGVIHKIGNFVFGFIKNSELLQIIIIALIIAPLSGFINNTAAVAIFLPMVLKLSNKSKTPATKLLIPLSYIAMLGGTLTVIGTSTNILANSILEEAFLPGFTMFEFTKIGFIVLVIGILYFLFIGRFLLPSRKNEEKTKDKIANKFLTELKIEEGSSFIGKTLKEVKFVEKFDVEILKIIRGKKSFVKNVISHVLEQDDVLVMFAEEQRIIELDGRPNEKLLLNFDDSLRRMPAETSKIVKVLVKSVQAFHQKTLEEIGFWKKYSAAIIGIHRQEKGILAQRLSTMKLESGEVFLVKVSKTNLQALRESPDLMLFEELKQEYDPKKMLTAFTIMILVVLLPVFNVLPIMVSALCGVFLMFITKCLRPNEIYASVHWNVIFLLAGLIPLGIAMQESGASNLVANSIIGSSDFLSPVMILGLFYLVTTVLTEIISNNAAVVLLLPIAVAVAQKLGLDPKAFALSIMFAASTSFLSPVGYQTNTMVFGAGNYRFSDFIKVGAPLNLILLFLTTFLIYHFFGL